MTRYTVVWTATALNQLAEIWLQASDRQAVTAATDGIDKRLAINAFSQGAELREGLRVLNVAPLRAIFQIREEDCTVEVARVRLI